MNIPVSPLMKPLPREIHPVERVMNCQRNESKSGPMTLGQALAAKARLIAWYKLCAWRTEPDVVELVSWHGAEMTVIDGPSGCGARLRCLRCGFRGERRGALSYRQVRRRCLRCYWLGTAQHVAVEHSRESRRLLLRVPKLEAEANLLGRQE